jgi:hypothetical protein
MTISKGASRLLAMALAVLASGATGQVRVMIATDDPTQVPWGRSQTFRTDVFYAGPECPRYPPLPAMEGTISLRAGSAFIIERTFYKSFGRSCADAQWSAQAETTLAGELGFGSHAITAHYSGSSSLPPASSAPLTVRVDPHYTWMTAGGVVKAAIATLNSWESFCRASSATHQERESLDVPAPPANMRFPYGHVAFAATDCSRPNLSPPSATIEATIQLQFPAVLPPGSELWVLETSRDRPSPQWKRLAATIDGDQARARLLAGVTPGIGYDRFINATVALAVPQPSARDGAQQDLWWGGPEGSGWGLNIAKNGQRIFATLFIYDDLGKPQWVVMPGGTWDPVHEVYHGDLFIPTGSPHGNYDRDRFAMGAPVGKGSLSFTSEDEGNFDYTLGSVAGGQRISRYKFGARGPDAPREAGMWWGGPGQDGWGVSLQQQGDALFATWYTYGADGKVTWFYMPGGAWTSPATYSGALYRTSSSPWAGGKYDAARLQVIPAGTLRLDFTTQDAATMTSVVDGVTSTRPIQRFPF